MSDKSRRPPVILLNMAISTVNQWESEFLNSNYVFKISDTGAVPVCVPSIEKRENIEALLDLADGVLLIGGKDYHPSYFNQAAHPETDLTRQRPHFDIAFAEAVMRRRMPVLGICAGCQLLNIVCGGELIQHLNNADAAHRGGLSHQAEIITDGIFSKALGKGIGEKITVNSYHHQAVDPAKCGSGLRIAARAFDGTVEAVESADPGRMVLGVQFHPERMGQSMSGIFELLKAEAEKFSLSR